MSNQENMDDMNAMFNSGFNKIIGMKLVEWSAGYAKAKIDIEPQHLNPLDRIHGGVLCSVLDMGCGFAGNYCGEEGVLRSMVTVSLTTNFVGRNNGGTLWIEGHQMSESRTLFSSNATIKDEDGTLIAHATGTFKWIKGSYKLADIWAEIESKKEK